MSQHNSPIHRIDNLKKYGVLSEEIAKRIQETSEKYENYLKTIHSIKSKHPNLTLNKDNANRFTCELIDSYQNAIEGKEQIEAEWKQLQNVLLEDLPSLES